MLGKDPIANKNTLLCCLIQLGLLSSLFLTSSAHAIGELLVAPTRVILEGRDRSARVNLINTGTETTTYRIKLEQKRMTETGAFMVIKEPLPGELFADKIVRFSPRQVTLPPGQAQAIRIILRKPANLPEGEYRSRLLFRSIPTSGSSNIENKSDPDSEQLTIQLIPLLGISIPLIVRHGSLSAEVTISDIQHHAEEKPYVSFTLNRTGNQSVYGDVTATFIDRKGEKFVVSKANGMAIYTPNPHRIVKLQLHPSPGLQIKNGQLHISFHQTTEDGGKLLTESTLSLP